jgi:hypothetical protein
MSTPWLAPTIRNGLLALLAANSAGRFSVEGFQRQSHAADELEGNLRHVTVFYRGGQFDKSKSGWVAGPFKHAMTFQVELTLAAKATADLSALSDPNATAQQLMSALAASISASAQADTLWDELAGIIWGILMAPANVDAMGGVTIEDRWVANIQKENPPPQGEMVILSGTMDYTCTVVETVIGDAGVPAGANAVDTTLQGTADLSGAPLDPAAQGAKSTP